MVWKGRYASIQSTETEWAKHSLRSKILDWRFSPSILETLKAICLLRLCQGPNLLAAFAISGHENSERVCRNMQRDYQGTPWIRECWWRYACSPKVAEVYAALTPKDCAGMIHKKKWYGTDRSGKWEQKSVSLFRSLCVKSEVSMHINLTLTGKPNLITHSPQATVGANVAQIKPS